jgi:DNA-binding response OmpR family regulator
MLMYSQQANPVRILVVEDEPALQEAMVTYLNLSGFIADGIGSLAGAKSWMQTHRFDILVLDLGLDDGDGLELLPQFQLQNKGLIITTARSEPSDRLIGLKAGADVYLVKPVLLEELVANIDNLSRRLNTDANKSWLLDTSAWLLESPDNRSVKLTLLEMNFLGCLAASPAEVVLKENLIIAMGQKPDDYDPRRMEILVRRLRTKIRNNLECEAPIETVHGRGYVFTGEIAKK